MDAIKAVEKQLNDYRWMRTDLRSDFKAAKKLEFEFEQDVIQEKLKWVDEFIPGLEEIQECLKQLKNGK